MNLQMPGINAFARCGSLDLLAFRPEKAKRLPYTVPTHKNTAQPDPVIEDINAGGKRPMHDALKTLTDPVHFPPVMSAIAIEIQMIVSCPLGTVV
ncbi:hypothetical protein NUW54_g5531 [Trametes sanguinea]|uniref:Uncharacterized protein n=1 Tax=Trametes sanguinea TaxID=158606 RepID=A0ACC1PUT8_9APHY|nr:hypothetical protein NUW54_g5531 [Trametes sanguinea]